MFKKVAFTYYPVTDVARARKFYDETLGLKSGSGGNQGDNWWVEYDLPADGCLALTNFSKEKPSDTAGGTIAFEAEDLDRLMTDLKAKGVIFTRPIEKQPWGLLTAMRIPGAGELHLYQPNHPSPLTKK